MTVSRERQQGGKMEIEDGENVSNQLNDNGKAVIEDLISLIDSVSCIRDYRMTQKKESHNLARRMKLLLPFVEEIGEIDTPIPEAVLVCLHSLKKALISAKKLLQMCHDGSKLYLALETEAMMIRFHRVYDKIRLALDGMPFDEFQLSEEVQEQVEFTCTQLLRAKRRTDTQDMELTMDLMVVLSTKNDDRNADRASIERLANKLALHTAEDLRTETIDVKKLLKGGKILESTQQIIDLLNKFKRIAGVEETSVLDEPVIPQTQEKSPSQGIIPHEFLCPITLEIMTDPVIVATGQTYERESIQQWLDSNHQTCPKTGQTLVHLSLASNVALRNIIQQWCEKNSFQIPSKDSPGSSENNPPIHGNEKITSLVQRLSSSQLEVQRKAVIKIRMLSKESPENRILIASYGGIPPLVQLLLYPDSRIQEHAVTALLNLSIDESNKKLISTEQPIPAIIEILQHGTIGAKENSAAALFSLSMLDENKVVIGLSNGIQPLVDLLQHGTIRGKKDAVTALFNLSLNQANKTMAIEAGAVTPLLQILKDKNLEMVDEALSILLLFASHPDGRLGMGQLSFIENLVDLIRDGTPKNRECATAVLLELGSKNPNLILAALQYGVYDPLFEVAKSGTNRAQRKANSLLMLISKNEELPCPKS